jgi:hypothetical protein
MLLIAALSKRLTLPYRQRSSIFKSSLLKIDIRVGV